MPWAQEIEMGGGGVKDMKTDMGVSYFWSHSFHCSIIGIYSYNVKLRFL